MKKIVFIIPALVLAAVACNKTQTMVNETPREISFQTMSPTKADAADIVAGTLFPDNTWKIYVSASVKNDDASVAQASLFENTEFATADDPVAAASVFKASPAQYYPLGSKKVDFIAYASNKGKDKPVDPAFLPTAVSDKMTFEDWDTYTNQQDLLYANLNGCTTQPTAQALEFHHAQAQIVIEAAKGATSGDIKITKIELLGLETVGTFEVDNSKQTLEVSWKDMTAGADKEITNLFVAPAENKELTTTLTQMGDALLVPQQAAKNIKISYKIGTDDRTWEYTFNNTRSAWMMNYKYIYQFTMTANEITFTESVVDWTTNTIVPAL